VTSTNDRIETADIAGTRQGQDDRQRPEEHDREGRETAARATDRSDDCSLFDTGQGPSGPAPADTALFSSADSAAFEQRWNDVQTKFVDDPRDAVAAADHLVAEVMQTLAHKFADRKGRLEEQWGDQGDADTEELRRAMQQYRSFFHRLLAA
jgi:hypothetical protein